MFDLTGEAALVIGGTGSLERVVSRALIEAGVTTVISIPS
jgi:NAD(P)-dependent dehydrogenase (short-subunit alcohol dehydrogenase family)